MWADYTARVKNKPKHAIVDANNHHAGFGTATANSFRKLIELRKWFGTK